MAGILTSRVRPIANVKRRDGRAPVRRLVPILLALLVAQGQGHAQSEPPTGASAAVGWIRPEEVPDRAEALLGRLDRARPNAAAQATVQQIEAGTAALGADLDALLARATAAIAQKGSLAAIGGGRRTRRGCSSARTPSPCCSLSCRRPRSTRWPRNAS
jgi:hypothetical protein